MQSGPLYSFAPASLADLALLKRWQGLPHVRRWWGADDPFDADDLADPRVAQWIVSCDSEPFANMQDYAVHGWEGHHFADLPARSRGIDQFIGPTEMVGKGHGTAFIGTRLRCLFDAGVPVVATDPHPDNARAIAVYRKVGFRVVGPPRQTEWGLVVPMEARP